jgi:hypothetical protein
MTSTSIRAAHAASRDAGACIEDDLRSLSDQLPRCLRRRRLQRWQSAAGQWRAFAATHVMSVLAGCALAAGVLLLIR